MVPSQETIASACPLEWSCFHVAQWLVFDSYVSYCVVYNGFMLVVFVALRTLVREAVRVRVANDERGIDCSIGQCECV